MFDMVCCTTGQRVVGVVETITAVASVSHFHADGTPFYAGESEVDWDSQHPRGGKGARTFVLEDGSMVRECNTRLVPHHE